MWCAARKSKLREVPSVSGRVNSPDKLQCWRKMVARRQDPEREFGRTDCKNRQAWANCGCVRRACRLLDVQNEALVRLIRAFRSSGVVRSARKATVSQRAIWSWATRFARIGGPVRVVRQQLR